MGFDWISRDPKHLVFQHISYGKWPNEIDDLCGFSDQKRWFSIFHSYLELPEANSEAKHLGIPWSPWSRGCARLGSRHLWLQNNTHPPNSSGVLGIPRFSDIVDPALSFSGEIVPILFFSFNDWFSGVLMQNNYYIMILYLWYDILNYIYMIIIDN